MQGINKQFKAKIANEGVVFEKVPRIPFSSPRLNYMTYGGLPRGRLIEFCGEEGGGKTTTALDVIKNAQITIPDKKAALIDVERTFDPEWADKIGVDVDKLILITPEEQTAEQIFEMTKSLIGTGELSIGVIDSLGAMVSAAAYEKTIEDRTYGGISVPLTLFSKEMIPICSRTQCSLIGINQMRDDMNSTYGGAVTTGGRAWRHNCSVRMQFSKSDYIDETGKVLSRGCENPAGHFVRTALLKSKVCKINRKVGFYLLNYLEGIDYVLDIIDIAVKENYIRAAGAWYSFIDPDSGEIYTYNGKELKINGRMAVKQFLLENKDWLDELTDQVNARIS
jgi:recombination protein RecA